MDEKTRSRVATGLMLIVLGLGIYGMKFLGDTAESLTLIVLGGLAIAGYLATRGYLLLVIGGVVLGLGMGSFGERNFAFFGEFTKLGLGLGFLLIYLIQLAYERRAHWWPLVPGGVLVLIGFRAWGGFKDFLLSDGWPLILVIAGVLILLGAFGGGKKGKRGR